MNHVIHIALGLGTVMLCACAAGEKKKVSKSLDEVTLGQRLNKPDVNQRSRYEKYLSKAADGRGTAGTQFQKQMFRSSTFAGANQAGGINSQFKTRPSMFSRLKFWGNNSSFSGADQGSSAAAKTFDTGDGFSGATAAREGAMTFSGAADEFGTMPGLTRSKRIGRPPNIIETIDTTSTKNSSYTEDEVKSMLGRN